VKLRIFADAREVSTSLAKDVIEAVRQRPDLVLGLPTGRTPVRLYRELARHAVAGAADFSQVRTFNLDEFLGVAPSDRSSFRQYMEQHLFAPVGLTAERIGFLDGSAPDPRRECAQYERALAEAGGVDLQILGIGANGHIGFNEPGAWLVVPTHVVVLRPETRRANAMLFNGDSDRVPCEALSMGVGTILRARRIVMLATGRQKARAVEQMVHGPMTTRMPASLLQLHPEVEVFLDQAAASRLGANRTRESGGQEWVS
jgi:glucosamine-6-phosphate deaminase